MDESLAGVTLQDIDAALAIQRQQQPAAFFDPNGVRMELTAQLADEFQMLQESKTAHARLDEWTARKAQWRKDRAEGKTVDALKPQTNDRPEFTAQPM